MIAFVGPCQTEIASTAGMTNATSTTHDSCSKSFRNAQPANTAAQSFAKFAGSPQSSRLKTSASSAHATAAATTQRFDQSGSAISTSANVAGITTTETIAIAGQRPTRGRCGATMNHVSTHAASATKA